MLSASGLPQQKGPAEAGRVPAKASGGCRMLPPSRRGRGAKPWGKGTQSTPCCFQVGRIKSGVLMCCLVNDLISGDYRELS